MHTPLSIHWQETTQPKVQHNCIHLNYLYFIFALCSLRHIHSYRLGVQSSSSGQSLGFSVAIFQRHQTRRPTAAAAAADLVTSYPYCATVQPAVTQFQVAWFFSVGTESAVLHRCASVLTESVAAAATSASCHYRRMIRHCRLLQRQAHGVNKQTKYYNIENTMVRCW